MKSRHWPGEFHLLAASGIFLAILILAYQIVGRHNRRLDWTEEKVYSVSKETAQILERLAPRPVLLRAFFAEDDPARRDFEILLKEMATHHPHFRYEFFDPDRSPSEAERYRVDAYRTSVIEYGGREERLQDFSEEGLANALIRLAHPQARTVCFTVGHEEAPLAEKGRTGLSAWKQVLEDHQYQVKEIQILSEGIPSECRAVVVAGPHYELLPPELDLLQKYPSRGRGLLLLLDPMDPGEGKSFQELLKPFGLTLGEDVVIDKVSRIFGGDFLVPLVTRYADHPITKQFRVATFLPIARTVRKLPEVPEGVAVTELALTMEGSWAETDLKRLEAGIAELDPNADVAGPVSLAAVVELKEAGRGARVGVIGDSDFMTNAHLRLSGNKDFALNVLQWLVRDDRWISIRPREPRFEPLFLKTHQSLGAAAFALGGLPLTALVIGSLRIWIRRRTSL